MDSRIERNQRYLTDLFAGPFRGHAIAMDPEPIPTPDDDLSCSSRPVEDFVPWAVQTYERQEAWGRQLGDDSVPYVKVRTGTQLFASAFGCPVHVNPGSLPSARPIVSTAAQADRLAQPALSAKPIERVFRFVDLVRQQLGPDVPISVPDIQSPFDIAALIWNKEDFFIGLYDAPDSVKRLAGKCHALLTDFLADLRRRVPNVNFCHCPYAWAPPELGVWLSEDEVGSMSAAAFEEFSLPILADMSRRFGGLFVHCCATADHQYGSFRKIPNLRGLNRVFQAPGPEPAIRAFAGQTVLMQAWCGEDFIHRMLDAAQPDSRYLLNMPYQPLDEAKKTFERLRKRCPRRE